MAKKMRNWLGPLVEHELKPAVDWVTDRTSSEKVVKQEFPEVKVTSRKEAFDPPSIDWHGPTIRQQWLDEGNTLRIKLERTTYEPSTVQIIKFYSKTSPVEALISDGSTYLRARIPQSTIKTFAEQSRGGWQLTERTEGGVFDMKRFEIVVTSRGKSRCDLYLSINHISMLGSTGSATFGRPTSVTERSNVVGAITRLVQSRTGEPPLRLTVTSSFDGQVSREDSDDSRSEAECFELPATGLASQMPLDTQAASQISREVEVIGGVNLHSPQAASEQQRARPKAGPSNAQLLLSLLDKKFVPPVRPPVVAPASLAAAAEDTVISRDVEPIERSSQQHRSTDGTSHATSGDTTALDVSMMLRDEAQDREEPVDQINSEQRAAQDIPYQADAAPPIGPRQESSEVPRQDCSRNAKTAGATEFPSWLPFQAITQSMCLIPLEQDKILKQPESWLPPLPGKRFPMGNIPVNLLTRFTTLEDEDNVAIKQKEQQSPSSSNAARASESTTANVNQDSESSSELASESELGEPPEPPRSSAQWELTGSQWGSSPPCAPAHVLPPNSSDVERTPTPKKTSAGTPHASSGDKRKLNSTSHTPSQQATPIRERVVNRSLHSQTPLQASPTSSQAPSISHAPISATKAASQKAGGLNLRPSSPLLSQQSHRSSPHVRQTSPTNGSQGLFRSPDDPSVRSSPMSSKRVVPSTLQPPVKPALIAEVDHQTSSARSQQKSISGPSSSAMELPYSPPRALSTKRISNEHSREQSSKRFKISKPRFGFSQDSPVSQDPSNKARELRREFLQRLPPAQHMSDADDSPSTAQAAPSEDDFRIRGSAESSRRNDHGRVKDDGNYVTSLLGPAYSEDPNRSSRTEPRKELHTFRELPQQQANSALARPLPPNDERPGSRTAPERAQPSPTLAPLQSQAHNDTSVFAAFTQAHPSYLATGGDPKHFYNLVHKIDVLLQADKTCPHPSMWDDFIMRHKTDYSEYLTNMNNEGNEFMNYEKFYMDFVEDPRRFKHPVLTKASLPQAVMEYEAGLKNEVEGSSIFKQNILKKALPRSRPPIPPQHLPLSSMPPSRHSMASLDQRSSDRSSINHPESVHRSRVDRVGMPAGPHAPSRPYAARADIYHPSSNGRHALPPRPAASTAEAAPLPDPSSSTRPVSRPLPWATSSSSNDRPPSRPAADRRTTSGFTPSRNHDRERDRRSFDPRDAVAERHWDRRSTDVAWRNGVPK